MILGRCGIGAKDHAARLHRRKERRHICGRQHGRYEQAREAAYARALYARIRKRGQHIRKRKPAQTAVSIGDKAALRVLANHHDIDAGIQPRFAHDQIGIHAVIAQNANQIIARAVIPHFGT